ncbi:MAG: class I SAM-dependent methyltransferase [Myxococcales bacterium]|nr:class I SAM-dependent methyltransferase [Myxococcales bacterium]MDH3483260.1 class I SAM-dependent methyltransferase [Myxococcales bacterium]
MSSFVWMKFLESSPERYDRGVELLSRGRIADVYDTIAELAASPGKRLLDIGCGTGGVSLACAARGARVVAIDSNPGMLDIARAKPVTRDQGGDIEWLELGLAEVEDRFGEAHFDAIVSCLVFSELSPDEQVYTLDMARSRLMPGGRLVIADEALPQSGPRRMWHRVRRLPLGLITYLLTQTSTRPVERLAESIRLAGFGRVEETRLWGDTFVVVSAVREDVGR